MFIPIPGSLDTVDQQIETPLTLLGAHETVAIVAGPGEPDDGPGPACVRRVLEKTSGIRVISLKEFREKFYPWFDPVRRFENADELARTLNNPTLRGQIRSAGLRFLIEVTGAQSSDQIELEGPAIPHIAGGVASYESHYALEANVWDLQKQKISCAFRAQASGTGSFIGFGLYGIWTVPRDDKTACRALGRVIATALADTDPEPKSGNVQEEEDHEQD